MYARKLRLRPTYQVSSHQLLQRHLREKQRVCSLPADPFENSRLCKFFLKLQFFNGNFFPNASLILPFWLGFSFLNMLRNKWLETSAFSKTQKHILLLFHRDQLWRILTSFFFFLRWFYRSPSFFNSWKELTYSLLDQQLDNRSFVVEVFISSVLSEVTNLCRWLSEG